MNALKSLALTGAAMAVAAIALITPLHVEAAPPLQVTAADPSSTIQGTLSLDVNVSGNGFDSSAAVSFLVTGTTNPGGITVKNVKVTGPKNLIATIDVADAAAIANFDIQVTQSGGRKGKGTSLFAVLAKVNNDPCAQAGLDFPAFVFRKVAGSDLEFHLADATGKCARVIYRTSATTFKPLLSYPVAGTSNRGRVIWYENALTLNAIDFTVSGTVVSTEPKRTIFIVGPEGGWGLEMTRDGRYFYTATDSHIVERIAVDKPFDRTVVRTFPPESRKTRVDSVNGDDSALYLNERVLAENGVVTSTELVRLDLITFETSVLAAMSNPSHLYQTAADLESTRITYVDFVAGCSLLQIADGVTGATFSNGQPRFGRFPTWHRGMIIASGYTPPNRQGKCSSLDLIVEVDPESSAQRELTRGSTPDGS